MTDDRKVPVRIGRDGRISFPKVVQYRLEDGTILDFPPTFATHPDLRIARTHEDVRKQSAVEIATAKHPTQRASLPYRVVIHDLELYDDLARNGALRDPRHTGSVTA